jgi:hypothetical protein
MTKDFEVLNNFVGFGNPKGNYWFIGLEEAGEFGDTEQDRKELDKYKKQICPVEPDQIKEDRAQTNKSGKRFTPIYHYMSYMVLASSGMPSDNAACRQYTDNVLLQAQSPTFQANLYPLGKGRLSDWNDNCEKVTGYKSRKDYYQSVEDDRFALLFNKWREFSPGVTICFGASYWDKFEKLLKITNESDRKGHDGWYRTYRSSIILCPFFVGHQMKNGRKEKIAAEIQVMLKKRCA